MKPPLSVKPVKSIIKKLGCVGLWVLNENGGWFVYDSSGNQNTGALQGNISWQPGKFGLTWSGDGLGDFIKVPHKSCLAVASGSFTVIASVAPNDVTNRNICAKYELNNEDFVVYFSSISTIRFLNRDLGATLYLDSNKNAWNLGQHYNIACVFDKYAPKRLIYIDGVLDASDVPIGAITPNSGQFRIGTNNQTNDFDGLIDYVMLFNRVLSDREIAFINSRPFFMFDRPMCPLFLAPPEIPASYMDLSSQIWTVKQAQGLFSKL